MPRASFLLCLALVASSLLLVAAEEESCPNGVCAGAPQRTSIEVHIHKPTPPPPACSSPPCDVNLAEDAVLHVLERQKNGTRTLESVIDNVVQQVINKTNLAAAAYNSTPVAAASTQPIVEADPNQVAATEAAIAAAKAAHQTHLQKLERKLAKEQGKVNLYQQKMAKLNAKLAESELAKKSAEEEAAQKKATHEQQIQNAKKMLSGVRLRRKQEAEKRKKEIEDQKARDKRALLKSRKAHQDALKQAAVHAAAAAAAQTAAEKSEKGGAAFRDALLAAQEAAAKAAQVKSLRQKWADKNRQKRVLRQRRALSRLRAAVARRERQIHHHEVKLERMTVRLRRRREALLRHKKEIARLRRRNRKHALRARKLKQKLKEYQRQRESLVMKLIHKVEAHKRQIIQRRHQINMKIDHYRNLQQKFSYMAKKHIMTKGFIVRMIHAQEHRIKLLTQLKIAEAKAARDAKKREILNKYYRMVHAAASLKNAQKLTLFLNARLEKSKKRYQTAVERDQAFQERFLYKLRQKKSKLFAMSHKQLLQKRKHKEAKIAIKKINFRIKDLRDSLNTYHRFLANTKRPTTYAFYARRFNLLNSRYTFFIRRLNEYRKTLGKTPVSERLGLKLPPNPAQVYKTKVKAYNRIIRRLSLLLSRLRSRALRAKTHADYNSIRKRFFKIVKALHRANSGKNRALQRIRPGAHWSTGKGQYQLPKFRYAAISTAFLRKRIKKTTRTYNYWKGRVATYLRLIKKYSSGTTANKKKLVWAQRSYRSAFARARYYLKRINKYRRDARLAPLDMDKFSKLATAKFSYIGSNWRRDWRTAAQARRAKNLFYRAYFTHARRYRRRVATRLTKLARISKRHLYKSKSLCKEVAIVGCSYKQGPCVSICSKEAVTRHRRRMSGVARRRAAYNKRMNRLNKKIIRFQKLVGKRTRFYRKWHSRCAGRRECLLKVRSYRKRNSAQTKRFFQNFRRRLAKIHRSLVRRSQKMIKRWNAVERKSRISWRKRTKSHRRAGRLSKIKLARLRRLRLMRQRAKLRRLRRKAARRRIQRMKAKAAGRPVPRRSRRARRAIRKLKRKMKKARRRVVRRIRRRVPRRRRRIIRRRVRRVRRIRRRVIRRRIRRARRVRRRIIRRRRRIIRRRPRKVIRRRRRIIRRRIRRARKVRRRIIRRRKAIRRRRRKVIRRRRRIIRRRIRRARRFRGRRGRRIRRRIIRRRRRIIRRRRKAIRRRRRIIRRRRRVVRRLRIRAVRRARRASR